MTRSVFEKPRDPGAFAKKYVPCHGCGKKHSPDFDLCSLCQWRKNHNKPLPNDEGDPVLDNVDDNWDGAEWGFWR